MEFLPEANPSTLETRAEVTFSIHLDFSGNNHKPINMSVNHPATAMFIIRGGSNPTAGQVRD